MTRWLILLALLSGCADLSGRLNEPPTVKPGRPSPLTRIIEESSPSPETPEPAVYDLLGILALVDNSPGLEAIRQGIFQATGAVLQDSYMPNPVLGLETEMMPLDDMGFGQARNKVKLSQRFETAGKAEARVNLATARKAEAEALYYHQRAEMLSEAGKQYFIARFAREKAEVLQRIEVLKGELLEKARALTRGGRLAEGALIPYEVALQKSRADRKTFEAAERQALRGLEGILGLPGGTILECKTEDLSWTPPTLKEAQASVLSHNSELILLDRRRAAAQAGIGAAESRIYPDLTVSLAYIRGMEMNRRRDDFLSAGIQFPLTLVDRNQGGRLSAEATLRQAEANLEASAALQVDTLHGLLEEWGILQEKQTLYEQKIIPLLEKDLALMQRQVDAGRVPAQQVLTATVALEQEVLAGLAVKEKLAGLRTSIEFVLGG